MLLDNKIVAILGFSWTRVEYGGLNTAFLALPRFYTEG